MQKLQLWSGVKKLHHQEICLPFCPKPSKKRRPPITPPFMRHTYLLTWLYVPLICRPVPAQPPPPRPLTLANAPGRRVLAPAAMWPRFLCGEHDGEGWEATVEKVRSGQGGRAEALVAFVARRTRGAGWKPMWLQLSSLRPLR